MIEKESALGAPQSAAAAIATSVAVAILALGLNASSVSTTTLAVALMAVTALTVLWSDRRYAFATLAFIACYCLFLLARQTVNAVVGVPPDEDGVLGTGASGAEAMVRTNVVLFVGIAGILAGWMIARTRRQPYVCLNTEHDTPWRQSMRRVSGTVLVLTTPLRLYAIWSTATAVAESGFYEARLTALSFPLRIADALFHASFFALLAARPNRKVALRACLLYLAVAGLSLLTLARFEFMTSIAVVALYLYHRQLNLGERWFTGKRICGFAALAPLAIGFLNSIGSRRGRGPAASEGLFAPILDFLRSQGVSVKVVVFGDELSAYMPQNRYYSFGPIVEFSQRISSIVTGQPLPSAQGQTAERAIEGHQFAHTISYLISPDDYLRGTGYGSSFVAELMADFGLLGVFVGSLAYGWLLTRSARSLLGGFAITFITLMLLKGAMFVPRASFVQPLVDPFAIPSMIAIALLIAVAHITAAASRSQRHTIKPTATARRVKPSH